MNEKLRPCPFCGNEAELFESPGVYFVECSNPKCNYPNNWDTREEAIAAWNTRAFEPKSGNWTLYENEAANAWECSVCHEVIQLMEGNPQENKYNFCPTCGARLKIAEVHNEAQA